MTDINVAIRKQPLFYFFLLAFFISWILYDVCIAAAFDDRDVPQLQVLG
ncbi:MAG: hypothetical protein JXA72_12930 [Bacteroidales bacterium]|nr:hypothetical protein [Bacteroidales bacterium]